MLRDENISVLFAALHEAKHAICWNDVRSNHKQHDLEKLHRTR